MSHSEMKQLLLFTCLCCLAVSRVLGASADSKPMAGADVYERLAISNPDRLSAASKRALERGYDHGSVWYCEFTEHDLKGDFAPEPAVIRRDPSAVITVAGKHHVYYTKSTCVTQGFGTGDLEAKVFPWDKSDVWVATSTGTWEPNEAAIPQSPSICANPRLGVRRSSR